MIHRAAMEPLELEPSSGLVPTADTRRRMDEPPPVRLIAVEDVRLLTPPNLTEALDAFYLDLLDFAPEPADGCIVYRAENLRLRLTLVDRMPLQRDGIRPIGIEVRSLRDAEKKLFDRQIEYLRQRGLLPGLISLLIQDPAGNWIELFESASLVL